MASAAFARSLFVCAASHPSPTADRRPPTANCRSAELPPLLFPRQHKTLSSCCSCCCCRPSSPSSLSLSLSWPLERRAHFIAKRKSEFALACWFALVPLELNALVCSFTWPICYAPKLLLLLPPLLPLLSVVELHSSCESSSSSSSSCSSSSRIALGAFRAQIGSGGGGGIISLAFWHRTNESALITVAHHS